MRRMSRQRSSLRPLRFARALDLRSARLPFETRCVSTVHVLPRLCGRIARPCDRSTYTSTSSGRSPAQFASPKHQSARLTAAISAALVTLIEFVASQKPYFGHTKPYFTFPRIFSSVRRVSVLAGCVRSRAPACAPFGFSLRSKVPFESYAFFGASPFVSFVPSPVRDAIRVAILRRALFSLRSNIRPPCLACASRPVRRMALSRLTQLDTGHNRPASSLKMCLYCMFHSRLLAVASIKSQD